MHVKKPSGFIRGNWPQRLQYTKIEKGSVLSTLITYRREAKPWQRKIVYYDKDSDFESEIKVLWTDNILKFVHYETTYYMLEYLFEKMLKIIEE